ncbi:MAG: hypothetical protein J3R72DRAFT_435960 [Linnemannia gamsii]|nr:MAG: hypothetical protein J3R72DRAFT_435960 [Linnemannia gamsii]
MPPQSWVTSTIYEEQVIVTATSALVAPTSKASPSEPKNNNSNGFQDFGGYTFMVLGVSILVAAVFFGRVCCAKRRERRRRQKDIECEVPPGYAFHLADIPIYDSHSTDLALSACQGNNNSSNNNNNSSSSSSSSSDHNNTNSVSLAPHSPTNTPGRNDSSIPPASSSAPISTTVILHPPRAALVGNHSSLPADPPSYESLTASTSVPTATASMSPSSPLSLTPRSSSLHN